MWNKSGGSAVRSAWPPHNGLKTSVSITAASPRRSYRPPVATTSPVEAPLPASPMKCSLDMFVANSDAPTANKPTLFPAKKYFEALRPFREW